MDPMNDLHRAAFNGSTERTIAVLARGTVDIDQADRNGATPLMVASLLGHERVVGILLSRRANLALMNDEGVAALHMSARRGHLSVTKLLVKAGADLEARISTSFTPLIMATCHGHSEVMGVLIEAGANPNSGTSDGMTPLFCAALHGHLAAIRVLLRAKADPLLTLSAATGDELVPLDTAAEGGHSEIVAELIQEYGIKGCGGASGGVHALRLAASIQRVDIMGMLTSAGVVDTGKALLAAVALAHESSVKFLLQQLEWEASGDGAGYLNTHDGKGMTLLGYSVGARRPCSPRITRLLVDAGADTTTPFKFRFRIPDPEGSINIGFNFTPLACADFLVSPEIVKVEGAATESQLDSLEAMRRLLMRVEAVHAVSWLWASDTSSTTHAAAAAVKGTGRAAKKASIPLVSMLPVLRRRAGRPRVLWAALHRHASKPY